MPKLIITALLLMLPLVHYAQSTEPDLENRITSAVDSTDQGELILVQTFEVNTSLESVWNAYTTKKGWENWATPVAEIDFKAGGLIQTNYDKNAEIGDEGTITLHVVNYIPQKMITLQAELTENFPEFMKADAEDLFNVITFNELEQNRTQIISYGLGYKNNEKYKQLMKFFIQGNESSYKNLIKYLETGQTSLNY
ncbi:MAG: SRPBCC domain-containing protein [Balneola sp.]